MEKDEFLLNICEPGTLGFSTWEKCIEHYAESGNVTWERLYQEYKISNRHGPYVKFDTEEDRTYFILKWS